MRFLLIFSFVFSSTCFADCVSELSGGRDSSYLQVSVSDIYEKSIRSQTRVVIKKLLNSNQCDDVITNLSCTTVVPGQSESEVCYVRTKNTGYFIVSRDYMENLNVVFNRFD